MTTERLSISSLGPKDHLFILELLNSDDWIKFIGDRHVRTPEGASDYVQKILDSGNIHYWVVRLKNDTTPIGIITFIKREYLDYPDIGFAFLSQFSGKGYAFEATQCILSKISSEYNHKTVFAITTSTNSNSIKLLKKLGFAFKKDMEVEHEKLQLFNLSGESLS